MCVPEAFKFNAVFRRELAEHPATEIERENLKNAAYFILHALSRHKYDLLALKKFDETGFLPLSSERLGENCGNRYVRTLKVLCQEGVIEQESSYYAAGRSRRYRLSASMDSSPQVFKALDGTVRRRYLRAKAVNQDKIEQAILPLKHLKAWLEGGRLTVNPEQLHAFLEMAFSKTRKLIAESSYSADVKAELRGNAALRVNLQIESIRRVLAGDFRPSNKGRDERLHTLLTRMKRELRSFLLYDEQPLVSLDIRSSQPYFLMCLLSKEFYKRGENHPLGLRSLISGQGSSSHSLLPPSPLSSATNYYSITFAGHSQLTERQMITESAFPHISWQEGFYKDFARKILGSEPTQTQTDRIKKDSMWLFFEPRRRKFNTAIFKSFEKFYPVEAGIVRGAQGLYPKALPLLLQRLEARVLLHSVTKTITKRLPLAPLLTIHDSILTTPEYAHQVKEIMVAELTALVGVAPGIKEEWKTAEGEFASVTDEVGGVSRTLTGIESFAQTIFKGALKSYKKAKKKNSERSFAHYELGSPLLDEMPFHDGKTLFSPRYYNPDGPGLPENPANVLPDFYPDEE